jgi:acylphosphatase
MVREAGRRGLDGWVRNLPDGSVQALVSGADDAVEALLTLCRHGPLMARVDVITEEFAAPPKGSGFQRA